MGTGSHRSADSFVRAPDVWTFERSCLASPGGRLGNSPAVYCRVQIRWWISRVGGLGGHCRFEPTAIVSSRVPPAPPLIEPYRRFSRIRLSECSSSISLQLIGSMPSDTVRDFHAGLPIPDSSASRVVSTAIVPTSHARRTAAFPTHDWDCRDQSNLSNL